LQVLAVTSPVSRGATASLTAQTVAGAQCGITIYYSMGAVSGSGTADSRGLITWTWPVTAATTPGTYIIVVTASSGGNSTSQQVSFTVQ
jgi:hypothetical protein